MALLLCPVSSVNLGAGLSFVSSSSFGGPDRELSLSRVFAIRIVRRKEACFAPSLLTLSTNDSSKIRVSPTGEKRPKRIQTFSTSSANQNKADTNTQITPMAVTRSFSAPDV